MAKHITALFPVQNVIYAVKITGKFDYMKTRSVTAQEKPYPRLVEVTKDQSVFEFNDTEGTIVDRVRTYTGYIISSGTVEIDSTDNLYLELPTNDNYFSKGFSQDIEAELEEAEN